MALPLPNYVYVADNHNIANGGVSWLNPDSWAQKLGNAGRFIQASVLSGTNSFYNTAAQVGEWVGVDSKQRDTGTWISSFDSDLGRYYRENQSAIDTTGFILGAIVPGLGGVKVLHAGQAAIRSAQATGQIGGQLSRATGLLIPNSAKYLDEAAAQINSSTTAVKFINANTLRAMRAGLWQNTLEAAAFKVAVIGTMFKSPVLEDADVGDIVWNISLGAGLGGAIGGIFGAAKLRGVLKDRVNEVGLLQREFLDRPAFTASTPASERIAFLAFDAQTAPAGRTLFTFDGKEVPGSLGTTGKIIEDRLRKDFNEIRTNVNELAAGDNLLGNILANISQPVVKDGKMLGDFATAYLQNFDGAVAVTRLGKISAPEIKWKKLEKDFKEATAAGKTPKDLPARPQIKFVQLFGESAGTVVDDIPRVVSLGDLHAGPKAVLAATKQYKFSNKFDGTADWSALKLSGPRAWLQAEARHIWANHILKEIPNNATINKYDIPVLERAYFDMAKDPNLQSIRVYTGEGPSLSTEIITSRQDLYRILKEAKEEVAIHYADGKAFGKADTAEAVAKVTNVRKSYLEGFAGENEAEDLFAAQFFARQWKDDLSARGLLSDKAAEQIDPIFLPKYAKVVYEPNGAYEAVDGNVLDAIALLKAKQKLYQENNDRTFAKVIGQKSALFPKLDERTMLNTDKTGAGAGMFSSENAN